MRQRAGVGDNLLRLAIVSSNNAFASGSRHPLTVLHAIPSDGSLDQP